METCAICGKQFKGLKFHTWRMHGDGKSHNPNKGYAESGRLAWNKGKSKETCEALMNASNELKRRYNNGEILPHGAAILSKTVRSANAKKQKFGGYRENAGRSKKFKVKDSYGNATTLQSSYELMCSQILEELSIKWIRPKALKYDGKNYFADFYLPEYDIYLDPKNNHKAKLDAEKINKVIEQNSVKVFVLSRTELTKEFIASLVQ